MPDIDKNYEKWNNKYSWSQQGDEWSSVWGSVELQWFGTIFPRIQSFLPVENILEIAPGFGRWTDFLKDYTKTLSAVDLSDKCIDFCNDRFKDKPNLKFHTNDGKSLAMIPEKSADFVFSYDSLVHVEIDVMEAYISQLSKIMKPNAVAFLHHSNRADYAQMEDNPEFHNHWRAQSVSHKLVEQLCEKYNLCCISQELINWGNQPEFAIDCLTVFTPKGSIWQRENRVFHNGSFMPEARQWKPLSNLYAYPQKHYEPKIVTLEKAQPLVSIIIPVWNKVELTRQCLEALKKNKEHTPYEIIVVDNHSTDATASYLDTLKDEIKVIANPENLGFAKACNQGAKEATGKYLVFLNNDTIPLSGWLDKLVSSIEEIPQLGVVGCKLLYADNSIQHCGVVMRRDRKAFKHNYKFFEAENDIVSCSGYRDAVTAACFLTPRNLFLELGMFDEKFLNGCEDIDYCCSVRQNGYKIYYQAESVLYHLESQTPREVKADDANFALYLKKWGGYALNTEMEVYAKDGFWQKQGNKYLPLPNPYMTNWAVEFNQLSNDPQNPEYIRLKKLFKHLYTVDSWIDDSLPIPRPEDDKTISFNSKKKEESPQPAPVKVIDPKEIVRPVNKKIPKILFVCHDFPPYRYAGAQIYAKNLAQAINKSGLAQVDILHPVFRTIDKELGSIEEKSFEGLRIFELTKLLQKRDPECIKSPVVEKAFDKFLTDNHYDVIHFHGLGQLSAVPVEVAKKHNIKTVMTLHDYWFLCEEWHMIYPDQNICSGPESVEKCAECLLKFFIAPEQVNSLRKAAVQYKSDRRQYLLDAFNMIDIKIAPSKYLKQRFEEFGFKNIKVVPLGFNLVEPVPSPAHQKIIFGYAGQIIARKGVNLLIDAFKHLSSDNIELHIYGKTGKTVFAEGFFEAIKNVANIHYFGEYTPDQLPKIFSTFDIAVIPSLMENYPLLVQEAFMFKKPVIASSAGGIPEAVIEDVNGLLFTPNNVLELHKRMLDICKNPQIISKLTQNIPLVRELSIDVRDYLDIYSGSESIVETKKLTVQFYVFKNVHWPMFENLYEYLTTRSDVKDIIVCIPNVQSITNDIDDYLIDKISALPVTLTHNPRQYKVDITFIADTIAGKVKDAGYIVNVGHGTISKGYYFTDSIWTERENWADLLCVPGEYAGQQFKNILRTRVVPTGMPKLDNVFSGKYNKAYLCDLLKLDPTKKIVLYAPTFNIDLSSIFNFKERFMEFDSLDYYTLIKLHGSTLPYLGENYKQIASSSKNIIYIEDANLAPYIGGADIMISDVSSAFMEFMACNKPVILYNNPNVQKYHGYNPEDIEYAWRDLGTQVGSFDECKYALQQLLVTGDDNKSTLRQNYAHQLFSDLAGNASANVWNAVTSLFKDNALKSEIPVLSIHLHLDNNEFLIRDQLYHIQFYSVMPIDLILTVNNNNCSKEFLQSIEKFHEFYRLQIVQRPNLDYRNACNLAIEQALGEYIIILNEGSRIFKNFDYITYKSFLLNNDLSIFTGLTNLANTTNNYEKYAKLPEDGSFARLSLLVFTEYKCQKLVQYDSSILPDFVALKRSVLVKNDDYYSTIVKHVSSDKMKINLSIACQSLTKEEISYLKTLWNYQYKLSEIDLKNYLQNMLKAIELYHFTDFISLLILTLNKTNMFNGKELIDLAYQSLFQRYYDVQYKQTLIKLFPPFKPKLSKQLAIIEKLDSGEKQSLVQPVIQPKTQTAQQPFKTAKKRVMLYYFKNVHIPIFANLLEEVRKQPWDVAIGVMPYAPEMRAGFTPEELEIIKSYGLPLYFQPQEFQPDVTLIADSVYPWVQNCGKLVHIGHGVLCKGQYYTKTQTALRENSADVVCVPGDYHASLMRQILTKPVIATGMSKLDPLFSGQLKRDEILQDFGLPLDFKYILFAPTFNDELSSIPFTMNRITDVIPDDKTILLIKLHGSTKQEYKDMYAGLPAVDPRVVYIDLLDITPFLAVADLMISDVSSAMMEFAALAKPIVLFNNPNWKSYTNYNPSDIEFTLRNIGSQVNSLAEIVSAVKDIFAGNDPYKDDRKNISDAMFANKYDGKATQKILNIVEELIK